MVPESTMASAKATEFLTKCLLINKEIVTYRWLSRELGIHVNEAKNELAAFYASSRSMEVPVHATFLLTGTGARPKRGEDEMDVDSNPAESVEVMMIMLVGEDELEDAKGHFTDQPSAHVYSLSATALKDAALLTTVSDQVRLQDVTKGRAFNEVVGIAVGPDVKLSKGQAKAMPPQPVASSSKASASLKQEEKHGMTEMGKTAETSKPLEKKKPGTLDWSRAKLKTDNVADGSKKHVESFETKHTKKPTDSMKKNYFKDKAAKEDGKLTVKEVLSQKTITKKDHQKDKEVKEDKKLTVKDVLSKKKDDSAKPAKKRPSDVMLSDSEGDAPSRTVKQQASKSPESEQMIKGKRNVIMSDQEDARPTSMMNSHPKKGKGRVIVSDDEDDAPPSLRAMMDLDDDQAVRRPARPQREAEYEDIEMQDEEDAFPVPRPPKAKRKAKKVIPVGRNGLPKRKIVKSRKTKNVKGYTVTEDYSSYESVSESEQPPLKEKPKEKKKGQEISGGKEDAVKAQTKAKQSGKPKRADLTSYFKKQ